jgi:hypothetical protein
MATSTRFGPFGNKKTTNPLSRQYNLYNSAVDQQAGDYDSIMAGYRNLLNETNANPGTYSPELATYAPSADYTAAIGNMAGLAATGGYSDADKANIRARGVSPIRAVYANANRDIDRQRGLQGGYSPNFGALKAKMAREMSSTLADKTTDVEAGIAERVAQNKIGLASPYAAQTAQQSDVANRTTAENADRMNRASEFNLRNPLETKANVLQGMTSLYGTTPALSSLFGSQANQAAQLENSIRARGQQGNLGLISQMLRGRAA